MVIEALNQVHREGGDGVFTELLTAHECARLTRTELTGIVSSLFFDGHILAAVQIANAVLGLLRRPEQRQLVTEHPGVRGHAGEELLRWSPLITLGMPRLARVALEVGGRRVAPGQVASVAFACRGHHQFQAHT